MLFTSITIRAVHIEVADSLDTISYINAPQWFISRRGQIEIIHCDNGTNFVGAEKQICENLNQAQIEKHMQSFLWSPSQSEQE